MGILLSTRFMRTPAILLVLAFTCALAEPEMTIAKAIRNIELKGKYVHISYEISLQGTNSAKEYLHVIRPQLGKNLVDVLIFDQDFNEIPHAARNESAFVVQLPVGLVSDGKLALRVLEIYRDRAVPKPAQMTLEFDEQNVEFVDNLYIHSAYPIKNQQTVIKVPNGNRIEYYTKEGATLNADKGSIHYGPFYDSYKEQELRVHYELSVPLIYFPSVQKHFELSHLGSIEITEYYALKNNAVELKGEFNRIKYATLTNYHRGNHIFRSLTAQLPRKASGLYYRDVVGNVSTSVATRESNYVQLEIRPRFPVLGGWQTKWEQGYKLLNQYYIKYDAKDPDLYIFNSTFGYAFKKIRADNYTLTVMLPPSAEDVKIYLPFAADVKVESRKSYLDMRGRKTLIIEKANMHSYYAKNFLVTYRVPAHGAYEKFLLMIAFFAALYAVFITCSRIKLKVD